MSRRKQLLIELADVVLTKKINATKIFDENSADVKNKQCLPAEFKISLERFIYNITKEDYQILAKDYLTDDNSYVKYGDFLKELKNFIDAKVSLDKLFDNIAKKI